MCLCICSPQGFLHPQLLPNRPQFPKGQSSSFSRHCLPPAIHNTPLLFHPPSWPNCLYAPAGPSASAQPFDVGCLGLSLPIAPHIVPDNLDHPQPQLPGLHSSPSISASSPGRLLGPRPQTNQPPPRFLSGVLHRHLELVWTSSSTQRHPGQKLSRHP